MKRFFSLIFCLFLLSSFQIVAANGTNQTKSEMVAEAINFADEVSHGVIEGSYGVDLWYVWLNTSDTHLLFLAMYSTIYPSPINYFVGQHYFTANGTEVFIGNRLLGFEIYEDVNGNTILDADYTDGFNEASDETRYYFLLNASETVDFTLPSKNISNNVTHYSWSVRYGQAQGNFAQIGNSSGSYIGDPETDEMWPSYFIDYLSAILDSLNLAFDYWVENDVAYLKIGLQLGTFSSIQVPGLFPQSAVLNFNANSLSTLYSTSVLSLKPYEISVEEPQGAEEPKLVNSTSIDIENKEAFRLVLGENYTLNGEPTPYMTTAGTYPINSFPGDVISYANHFTNDAENTFKEQLGETSPNLSSNVTLSIRKSSLIYRVCYSTWSNRTLSHDPLFIAYTGKPSFINPQGLSLPQTWLITTAIIGTAILIAAAYRHTKIRNNKLTSPTNTIPKKT